MKKRVYVAVAATLVVAIGGLSFYGLKNINTKESQNQTGTTQQTTKAESKITFSEEGKRVAYDGQTGKTALEVLKSLTNVDVETSTYGDFVTGINGVKADASSEYWSFYVGGAYANEGAGTYKTKDGEKIEWRLEKLQQ